jgi:hypothetical protein
MEYKRVKTFTDESLQPKKKKLTKEEFVISLCLLNFRRA